jgi:Domain of unknown function (DUF6249)
MFQGIEMGDDLVNLVAVCLFFGMPIIIVIAVFIYKAHRATMWRETVQQMLDKGMTVPPELLANMRGDKGEQKSSLNHGIILIAIGLGVVAMFYSRSGFDGNWGVGMVPLLMGVGYLAIWALEGRRD